MAAPHYQSLYRRYRSQRFSEVLGQDHVTKALRNAVRDGRVGHAYLFSGPRGCGKTSTARILAKVLNCAAPEDGEPDCTCDNCLAVEKGQVVDWLLEQDAASKSKVDDMRDLLDRVPLGTSGNRKVIILDEVHMLSQGAENALLKTLEEPPQHVVFVLATTDPQKVRATIRSRTQQFEFHLLPTDILAEHVRYVIHDAGLTFADEDEVVAHVVRVGGGSARDTLSALDQVAALGEVVADTQPVDAIVEALATPDAGAALVAVADAMATGRDPRGVGEAIIGRLRDAFLALMGVGDTHLPASERSRAHELGERLGPAGLTRALDVLGDALTELSRKPDPRVVLEVALVRITRPDADRSLDAVLARIERLEGAVRSGDALPQTGGGNTASGGPAAAPPGGTAGAAPPAAAAPPGDDGSSPTGGGGARSPGSPPSPPAGRDPSAGGAGSSTDGGPASAARAVLAANRPGRKGAGASRAAARPAPSGPSAAVDPAPEPGAPEETTSPEAPAPAPTAGPPSSSEETADVAPPTTTSTPSADTSPSPAPSGPPTASAAAPAAGSVDLSSLGAAWSTTILPGLPTSIRSRWRGGRWVEEPAADGAARFELDNEWHQRACEEGRREVEQALAAHFGAPVSVELVIVGGGSGAPGAGSQPGRGPSPGSSGPGGGAAPRAPQHDGGGQGPAPTPPPDDDPDDIGDIGELVDAKDVAVGGVDLLMREFGGGELVEEDL